MWHLLGKRRVRAALDLDLLATRIGGSSPASSLGALRLILSGMLDRVPALTPIVPHLGGVLSFLAQRLDDQTSGANAHAPTHYMRTRLRYDTCSFHPPALHDTIETVGLERLLLRTDFPSRGALDRSVHDLTGNLAAEAHTAVLGGNARRHFVRLGDTERGVGPRHRVDL